MESCERFVNEVLPYVRACFVEKLVSEGLSQKEIAEKLNISQPLVSMYLNGKRGKELNPNLKKKIMTLVEEMDEFRICPICKNIRDDIPR